MEWRFLFYFIFVRETHYLFERHHQILAYQKKNLYSNDFPIKRSWKAMVRMRWQKLDAKPNPPIKRLSLTPTMSWSACTEICAWALPLIAHTSWTNSFRMCRVVAADIHPSIRPRSHRPTAHPAVPIRQIFCQEVRSCSSQTAGTFLRNFCHLY